MIEGVYSNITSTQQRSVQSETSVQKGDVERSPKNNDNELSQGDSQGKVLDKDQIEAVVKSMNEFLEPTHTSLKFKIHEELKEYYVTVIDDKTKEVVKEIPSKKLLDFYAAMTERIGLLVDEKI